MSYKDMPVVKESYSISQIRFSIVLKIIVFISAAVGTFLSVYSSRNSFMSGTNVFMYFTIQSNIVMAISMDNRQNKTK